MQILVAYDVNTETAGGRRRLRRVAQACLNVGQRVQKSVFECMVNEAQYEEFLRRVLDEINVAQDSLRVYRLMEPKERYTREFGTKRAVDFESPLVI